MKVAWEKIISAGISEHQDFSSRKKIRLVNMAVILTLPIIFLHLILNIISGEFSKVISLLILLTSFIGVYVLNFNKKDQIALLLLFSSTAIYIYSIVYLNTIQGPIHFTFIALSIAIFYWVEKRWVKTVLFFFCIISFISLNYYQIKYLPIGSDFSYAISILYFIVLYFGLNLFDSDHKEYQRIVEQKNEELKENNIVVEQQREQLIRLDEFKTRFFTNITHEFRTPLTLVKGSVAELKEYETLKNPKYLDAIENQSDRLLNLINEILDLSKLQSGILKLNLSNVELLGLTQRIWSSFESYADIRKIKYELNTLKSECYGDIDIDNFEKILNNLLSNALKFSAEESSISMSVDCYEKEGTWIKIIVEDSGIGISTENLEFVFDPYFHSEVDFEASSGIGLALVKELVEIQRGSISVESEENKGTKFTVDLPVNRKYFKDRQILFDESNESVIPLIEMKEDDPIIDMEESNQELLELLIVDDNTDIRNFLYDILKNNYRITLANNGKEGIEYAKKIIPDIIISDVMMPEVDGIQLTSALKKNVTTSHIPIILLTAKADKKSRLEGLEAEADDYILKPFDKEELFSRIKNLIKVRGVLQEKFIKESFFQIPKVEEKSMDNVFIEKLVKIIHANMDNSDMTIEYLASEIGLSRSQLYRKVNALTGLSISLYVRNIRLKYAYKLLKSNSGTIAEIAYKSGFNSPNYFTTCFTKLFKISPTEINS